MKKPKDIADEKVAGKESGALDNIDKERGDPGKGTGGATLKPEQSGDRSWERNRAPSPGSTPLSQEEKLQGGKSG